MQPPLFHNYSHYTEADFMADPYFQQWVITASEEHEQFWKQFIAVYPFKKDEVERARQFLLTLRFKEHLPSEQRIEQRFLEHLQEINKAPKMPVINTTKAVIRRMVLLAACIAGIVVLGSLLYFKYSQNTFVVISTGYGDMKKIGLPDSSTIVLNAHSQVKFAKQWQKDRPREIWLDGEAFLNITHLNRTPWKIQDQERFLVHAKDLTIEVLGTSFNVRQRRGKTEVVLQSGKVVLTLHSQTNEKITMVPGDMVTYNTTTRRAIITKTTPENYTAWTDHRLILNNPTAEEVCHYLEDNFGKKFVWQDRKLANKKIEGPILVDNLDDALFILSTVLNANIEKKDSLLILHSR